ncbi:transglycosylase domain-containing protein [Cytophagaceae bacterium YF14B1]|uniref:Transglycosylase domain-containing protein n=1 Tax=Xanthocytophaga flava TaxID=3048013 RepID=A0AAE3QQD3_9BACT|nr:transglycosylase domain-containing protein [Xanthocytophaga flavus]MDJ1483552.1 transglycosylase domain-containing protein [Xanthocytophaga flavus]
MTVFESIWLIIKELYAEALQWLRKPKNRVEKSWMIFIALLLFFRLYLWSVEYNFLNLYGDIPTIDKIQNPKIDKPSELYTSDGVLIGRYYRENRNPVTYKEIPKVMVDALVATEDIRFYDHAGIDLKSLFAAVWDAITDNPRGASTITQQLAKNLYKTRRQKSQGLLSKVPGVKMLVTKTKEWMTAINIERTYTKEEIITLYLNTVDFGSNAYGIKTAAQTFFNTTTEHLTTEQAALLVGLLKAPTTYSPVLNPKNSLRRRNTVFSQMQRYGYLTAQQVKDLSQKPIELDYKVEQHTDGPNNYFRSYINSYLENWCTDNDLDLYTDGLKVYCTIDSRMQKYGEDAVKGQVKIMQNLFDSHWSGRKPWTSNAGVEAPNFIENNAKRTALYKYLIKKYKNTPDSVWIVMNTPKKMKVFSWQGEKEMTMSPMDSIRYYKRFLHAGMMTMDPFTGYIKAWVGGIDFEHFQYDHVKQSKRQPGSTFKPFVYLTAIDKGWAPCDKIQDIRKTFNYIEDGEPKSWTPSNATGTFTGRDMTLRHALGRSINSVTAQLTEKVTPDAVAEYAHRVGIKSYVKPVPSIGLGSGEVTIMEMTAAYSTFVNEGIYTEPLLIMRIEDSKGNIIHQFTPERKRVLSQETAWLMIHMLKGGIEEPGGTVQNLWSFDLFRGNELAGKTGTSQDQADGWFMGLSKDLVTGVWMGGDDPVIHWRSLSMGEGSKTALPVYGRYMEKVYSDKSLGITMGYFPKPKVPITKDYHCVTILPKRPTVSLDSLRIDGGDEGGEDEIQSLDSL